VGEDAVQEEARRYRRLQMIVALAGATLAQDPALTPVQGVEVILWARRQALELFPGTEQTFDMIYRSRLVRIMQERFGEEEGGSAPGQEGEAGQAREYERGGGEGGEE
jgi:hypothetical protein